MSRVKSLRTWDKEDISMGEKAIDEWIHTHLYNEEFVPMFGCYINKLPMVAFFHPRDEMPFSVQYAGNGKYFKTRNEMMEYFEERRWKAKKGREYRKNWLLNNALKYLNEHPEDLEKLKMQGQHI